jgi:hypothetical protein
MQPQTHALDRASTRIGKVIFLVDEVFLAQVFARILFD